MKYSTLVACLMAAACTLPSGLGQIDSEAYKKKYKHQNSSRIQDKVKIFVENKKGPQRALEPFSREQHKSGDMLRHEFVHTMDGSNKALENEQNWISRLMQPARRFSIWLIQTDGHKQTTKDKTPTHEMESDAYDPGSWDDVPSIELETTRLAFTPRSTIFTPPRHPTRPRRGQKQLYEAVPDNSDLDMKKRFEDLKKNKKHATNVFSGFKNKSEKTLGKGKVTTKQSKQHKTSLCVFIGDICIRV